MSAFGVYWIGLAFVALALFPLCVYLFFWLVVLEKKSQSLVDDLSSRGAFRNNFISSQWKDADTVTSEIRDRYGNKRFAWPVGLLVFFHLVGFSVVWDLVRYRLLADPPAPDSLLFSPRFLCAAELPMMAFLGVVIFNYGHMLRRLYVWDITTHVFWNALYRTWLVVGVAAVIAVSGALGGHENGTPASLLTKLHAEFFALGFIINPVLQGLMQKAQTRFLASRARVPDLPLSLIQGMSFWHEYRLEEEGIENVQNLATCEIVDLALTTRYNMRTLLDWVDQAVLIHRMGPKAIKLRDEGFVSGAIDMAWSSPANSDDKMAQQVAKTLGAEPTYVEKLMDGLLEDAQVMMLWDLWQSQPNARKRKF